MAAEWFIRQGEKVFGPFDSAKLKQFADAKKIGPQTEIAQSNTGPWVPASRVKGLFANASPPAGDHIPASRPAATTQKSALPPPLDPPAGNSGRSITDYSVIVGIVGIALGLVGFAFAWLSSTAWLAMPTSIVGFLVGGLACALVWMQRSQGMRSDNPPIAEIAGAAVSLLAMIAVLMLPSGSATKEVASRGEKKDPPKAVTPVEAPPSPKKPESAPAAASNGDPQGWQGARFGMTVEEVRQAIGDRIQNQVPPGDWGTRHSPLVVPELELAGEKYIVYFQFGKESGRLEQVLIRDKNGVDGVGSGRFASLVALMTKKYGPPAENQATDGGNNAIWSFPTTDITVALEKLPGFRIIAITYTPTTGKATTNVDESL